jgi:hypothetical protein
VTACGHAVDHHGVLTPNAKLRARVVPQGPAARGQSTGAAGEIRRDAQPVQARAQHIGWGRLLTRVFDIDMRRCPVCGAGELDMIAAILAAAPALQLGWRLHAVSGIRPEPGIEAKHATRGYSQPGSVHTRMRPNGRLRVVQPPAAPAAP